MKIRGTQSDARPIALPVEAFAALSIREENTALSDSTSEIFERCRGAVVSFRDASSQRAQAAAIKVLGAALREFHVEAKLVLGFEACAKSGWAGVDFACYNGQLAVDDVDESENISVCRPCELAAPVLAQILLNTQTAPWVVTCAALRALLRASPCVGHCGTPPVIFTPIIDLLLRLEKYSQGDHEGLSQSSPDLIQLSRDVHAVNVLNSERQSREWIAKFPTRMCGASTAALTIVRASLLTKTDWPVDHLKRDGHRKMLDVGLDDGLKVLQDICCYILSALCSPWKSVDANTSDGCHRSRSETIAQLQAVPSFVVRLNWLVLGTSKFPRRCTIAAAAGLVTATIANCQDYFLYRETYSLEQDIGQAIHISVDERKAQAEEHLTISQDLIETIACTLEDVVIAKSWNSPAFVQLALLRSLVESPWLDGVRIRLILGPQMDTSSSEEKLNLDGASDIVNDGILKKLCRLCTGNADMALRFLAMESVVLCLRQMQPGTLCVSMRDLIIRLMEERCQEAYPGVPSQMRDVMDVLIRLDSNPSAKLFWTDYVVRLLDTHSTSIGIYPPLSRLTAFVGAQNLLSRRPMLLAKLLSVIAGDANAAKPIADWLEAFWKVLVRETSTVHVGEEAAGKACSRSRGQYHPMYSQANVESSEKVLVPLYQDIARPVIDALTREDMAPLRERVVTYVMPALFRACEGCELDLVRAFVASSDSIGLNVEDSTRVYVAALSAARHRCSSVVDMSDTRFLQKLRVAVRSQDSDVRLAAVELVARNSKNTEPITESEFKFMLDVVTICLIPSTLRFEMSRIQQALRKFMERTADSRSSALSRGGWWSKERKALTIGSSTESFERRRLEYLNTVDAFIGSISARAIYFTFPGSAPDRRKAGLELLSHIAASFGAEHALNASGRSSGAISSAVMLAPILQCISDNWEVPRLLALSFVSRLQPIASRLSANAAESLLKGALAHVLSPRVSEACPGASVCRYVFRKCVIYLESEWQHSGEDQCIYVSFPQENDSWDETVETKNKSLDASPVLHFLKTIICHLSVRSACARGDLSQVCMSGLFYGDLCVLRGCIEDADWALLCASPHVGVKAVQSFARGALSCLRECVHVALQGLEARMPEAETISTNDFVHERDSAASGPISHSKHTPEESQKALDILTHDRIQKVSTACHLSVKEVCLTLGCIVQHISVVKGCGKKYAGCSEDTCAVLEVEDMCLVGELFDMVLSRVRHNGVIKGAADGYEQVCTQLLQPSAGRMRDLPQEWAENALNRAINGEMYALRRSAGVPFFVLGAIRAEASVLKHRGEDSSILRRIMEILFLQLSEHGFRVLLNPVPLYSSASEDGFVLEHSDEEAVVHCLNVIRFIVLDSTVARVVPIFLGRCFIVALYGFQSSSWLVRNSAFMLFSALVKRGVGTPRERHSSSSLSCFDSSTGTSASLDGNRRMHSVTARQFFARYPELHGFLLAELKKWTTHSQIADSSSPPYRSTLFPVLYLLSSFAPSVDNDEENSLSTSHFNIPLQICLRSQSACVRRAAASACVSLLEDIEMVPYVVENSLTSRLPYWSGEPKNEYLFSQNQLHGELLRLAAILKGTRSLMRFETIVRTVRVVSLHIASCTWIVNDRYRNGCPVTRCAMLKVLYQSSKVSMIAFRIFVSKKTRSPGTEIVSDILRILDLSEEASSTCLKETSVCIADGPCAVGLSAMALTAAKLRALVLRSRAVVLSDSLSENSFVGLISSLSHPVFEVREIAVKLCGELLNMGIEYKTDNAAAAASIWSPLIDVLRNETYHPILSGVLNAIPKVLCVLSEYTLNIVWRESGRYIWFRTAELSFASPSIQLREAALVLLGHCVKIATRFAEETPLTFSQEREKDTSDQSSNPGSIVFSNVNIVTMDDMEQWMNNLELARTNRQLSTTRVAALQSIEASSVLQSTEVCFSSYRARCLIVLADLLQDDHEQVQQAARSVARQLVVVNDAQPSLDILPALIAAYEVMSSSETTILSYLEEILGMTMLETGKHGLLHVVFSCRVSCSPQQFFTDSSTTASISLANSQVTDQDSGPIGAEMSGWECDLNDLGCDADGPVSKLFTDDSDLPCTEPAMTLQLAIWAVYCMRARKRREWLGDVENESLLQHLIARWIDDLTDVLLYHATQESNSTCPPGAEGSILLPIDFSFQHSKAATSYFNLLKKIARLAAASLMLPTEGAWASSVSCLRQALEQVSGQSRIHPSLFSSAQGVANLLVSPTDGEALHAVLFLLPRLPYS
jgi:hypothetical protein